MILGGALEQEGSGGGRGRGAGGTLQYVRENYKSFERKKSDGCSKNTSLKITCLLLFIIVEDFFFDVIIASKFVVVHGSQDIRFQSIGTTMYLPLFNHASWCGALTSLIKRKIYTLQIYNKRGDVVMQCHHH